MIKNMLQECDYEHGYRQALIDVSNWIDKHSITMKNNKMFNYRRIHQLLNCLINNYQLFIQKNDDLALTLIKDDVILSKDDNMEN